MTKEQIRVIHLFEKNGKVLKLFCLDNGPITNDNVVDFEVGPNIDTLIAEMKEKK